MSEIPARCATAVVCTWDERVGSDHSGLYLAVAGGVVLVVFAVVVWLLVRGEVRS